jgi:hypothetical protein
MFQLNTNEPKGEAGDQPKPTEEEKLAYDSTPEFNSKEYDVDQLMQLFFAYFDLCGSQGGHFPLGPLNTMSQEQKHTFTTFDEMKQRVPLQF